MTYNYLKCTLVKTHHFKTAHVCTHKTITIVTTEHFHHPQNVFVPLCQPSLSLYLTPNPRQPAKTEHSGLSKCLY